jgi:hypothetical protein
MRTILSVLLVLSISACCCPKADKSGSGSSSKSDSKPKNYETVQIDKLLADYKNNEIRADGDYKGKYLKVAGKAGDIKKGAFGGLYVMVGTGKKFEFPAVQCHLKSDQEAKASKLNKGDAVTVKGKASGLMGHVQLKECEVE